MKRMLAALLLMSTTTPAFAATHTIQCSSLLRHDLPCSAVPCLWDDTKSFEWGTDGADCPVVGLDAIVRCKAQFQDVGKGWVSVNWSYCTVDGTHQPLPLMAPSLGVGLLRGDGWCPDAARCP